MGNSIDANLIIIGLDNSGKTSILNYLKQPNQITKAETTPTITSQKHKFSWEGIDFQVHDMSGDPKNRDLWIYHAAKIDGILFVVDSSDMLRLGVASSQLQLMIQEKTLKKDIPIVVFGNKSDIKEHASVQKIAEKLHLKDLMNPHQVFLTNAKSGKGIKEGMDWFTKIIKTKLGK